jgi:hypothetical protein
LKQRHSDRERERERETERESARETTYQVVQNGHNIVLTRAHAAIVVALEGTNGIVSVHGPLAFLVHSAHHAKGIIREKSTRVQSDTQQLSNG